MKKDLPDDNIYLLKDHLEKEINKGFFDFILLKYYNIIDKEDNYFLKEINKKENVDVLYCLFFKYIIEECQKEKINLKRNNLIEEKKVMTLINYINKNKEDIIFFNNGFDHNDSDLTEKQEILDLKNEINKVAVQRLISLFKKTYNLNFEIDLYKTLRLSDLVNFSNTIQYKDLKLKKIKEELKLIILENERLSKKEIIKIYKK